MRRDVFRGQVWSATPLRTVSDSKDMLAMVLLPGTQKLASTTWIEWCRTGDDDVRSRALPNLAAGTWELDTWTWRDTTKLSLLLADAYFSVDLFFGADGFERWYVNFERPYVRTGVGIDTFDLLLDMLVEPDLSYRWKDEDEYAEGCRLGIITETEQRHVQDARDQVLELLRKGTGPFEERWLAWRPEPGLPLPTLPAGVTTA
ncbi:MAG TPA: DUF402 domain-containing protein [Actinopolymorphaceae bacterium]|nr:DUF402 domain-containing protein [Actinopolymorphaceae bacterium]